MAETITEKQVQDMMKLNKRATEFFKIDLSDVMIAEDLSETTRKSDESPTDFHARRRFAITKIINQVRSEWQIREDKLINYGKMFGATFSTPLKEEIENIKQKEINELVNGKYPITMYINQMWQMIKDAEKKIALLDILPKDSEK